MSIVQAHGLVKQFGTFTAIRDITFDVRQGEVLALLGPNGAGKTTTIRCLAGILQPSAGYAIVAGYDVRHHARLVRRHVGLLTEFPGLYGRLTPLEYLDFFGAMHGMSPADRYQRAEALLRHFGLWEARNRRLGQFSKGMRQKMALVRALLHDPQVLFLDEPTSALDPEGAFQVRSAIADLRTQGHTIVLCTHNLVEAELLADRIVIMGVGRVLAIGTPDALRDQVLGAPLFTLRLAQPLDDLASLAGEMVEIEAVGDTWVRFRTTTPETTNPALVRRILDRGGEIVALTEEPRRLEDVYLHLMGAAV
ncbi:ABC transporter ATP-binding protein [Ardenticatena maritima]|uniref:ABC transporter ATP-binding protein n=1 Tax=Ardenticatena maritima TaxID=872965 RepID=UPI001910BE52|nr:ABC transporter ATP-binding protein [Ardenticatena maritima]